MKQSCERVYKSGKEEEEKEEEQNSDKDNLTRPCPRQSMSSRLSLSADRCLQ
jgi:hypothetical protein